MHPAQVAVAVLQKAELPEHWPVFVAEHWPHAPDPWHAGLVEVGHGRLAAVPLSPLQATQELTCVSHTGRFAGHCALVVHVQECEPTSQVDPDVHCVPFVAEH